MEQPYVDGITLPQILEDGWCRGFETDQTMEEAKYMGFTITEEDISIQWKLWDINFKLATEKNKR